MRGAQCARGSITSPGHISIGEVISNRKKGARGRFSWRRVARAHSRRRRGMSGIDGSPMGQPLSGGHGVEVKPPLVLHHPKGAPFLLDQSRMVGCGGCMGGSTVAPQMSAGGVLVQQHTHASSVADHPSLVSPEQQQNFFMQVHSMAGAVPPAM